MQVESLRISIYVFGASTKGGTACPGSIFLTCPYPAPLPPYSWPLPMLALSDTLVVLSCCFVVSALLQPVISA